MLVRSQTASPGFPPGVVALMLQASDWRHTRSYHVHVFSANSSNSGHPIYVAKRFHFVQFSTSYISQIVCFDSGCLSIFSQTTVDNQTGPRQRISQVPCHYCSCSRFRCNEKYVQLCPSNPASFMYDIRYRGCRTCKRLEEKTSLQIIRVTT